MWYNRNMRKRKEKLEEVGKIPLTYHVRVLDENGNGLWFHSSNDLKAMAQDDKYIEFYKGKPGFSIEVKDNLDIQVFPLSKDFKLQFKEELFDGN